MSNADLRTGGVRVIPATDASTVGKLSLANKTNSHAVTLASPDTSSADYNARLPAADGTPGQVLITDGFGNWGWSSSTPGSTWAAEVPAGTLNGVNKTFTLSHTPTAGSLTFMCNILQREGTDFTITGPTITMTVAAKFTDTGWFWARYQF